MKKKEKIGVLLIGMNGCVANTTILGHNLICNNKYPSFGLISEHDSSIFGGWDLDGESIKYYAQKYKILPGDYIQNVDPKILCQKAMKGIVTDYDHPSLLTTCYNKKSMLEKVDKLINDINTFKIKNKVNIVITVYLASPLRVCNSVKSIKTINDFERLLKIDSDKITTSMIYCYSSLKCSCPFIDFTPNSTLETPALIQLAERAKVPIVGRDGNTGQTLLKSLIAEMLKIRNLKLTGWYSTNILGNNDGFILTQPGYNVSKLHDKTALLPEILGYNDFDHKVTIDYYKMRGDNKESWDNIDFLGFLGMNMNFKINWLGKDSILATPLILDLLRFTATACKNNEFGLLDYLGIFFKNPIGTDQFGFFGNWLKLINHFKIINGGLK